MLQALRDLNNALVDLANARIPDKYDPFIAMGVLFVGFVVFMLAWHPWTQLGIPGENGRDGRDGRVIYIPKEDGGWHRKPLNPVPYAHTDSPLPASPKIRHTPAPATGAPTVPGVSPRPTNVPTTLMPTTVPPTPTKVPDDPATSPAPLPDHTPTPTGHDDPESPPPNRS